MKMKLDENLGSRGAEILAASRFDVMTVGQQQMTSATDEHLLAVCHAEGRSGGGVRRLCAWPRLGWSVPA